MNGYDIDKAFVSPIDKFLHQFNETHPKSASQIQEIKKFQRIYNLRDNPNPQDTINDIWKDF
ncbi:MAG: CBU_0585 family protein [Legionella sp.]